MTLPTSGLITVNDRGARAATTFGSVAAAGGNMVFIKKLTASSSSTLSFVNGASSVVLDSTYKEYVFTFNNIHPSNDNVDFYVNASVDGGSNYNVTKTTTFFRAGHDESGSEAAIEYRASEDVAQGTGVQIILQQMGNDNDQCGSGTLHLFNPSSTTFVKHFMSRVDGMAHNNQILSDFIAGYFNTTSAINAIQFSIEAGTIESGDICLYGIL
tara:strand:- start:59 stop:697 length:639 start_codon:yes stop_codon:yes gene_type:complete